MTDQERHALETTIANLAADIHETENRLSPLKKQCAELRTSLTEQRNTNEFLITENAGIRAENEQFQRHIADAQSVVEIVNSEIHRARETAREVLTQLVLVPSERTKREQQINTAESISTIRMWTGVWRTELDRPTETPPAPQAQFAMGVL